MSCWASSRTCSIRKALPVVEAAVMNSGQNQKDTGTEPGTHGCKNYIAACQNLIIRHAVIYIVVIEEPQSGNIILAAAYFY